MQPVDRRAQMGRPKVQVEKTEAPKTRAVKLLMDLRPEAQKRGPGPSKTMYRLTRIWKKTWVRRAALVVLPGILAAMAGWKIATNIIMKEWCKHHNSSTSEYPYLIWLPRQDMGSHQNSYRRVRM